MVKNFVSVSGIIDDHQLKRIYEIYQQERLNFTIAIGYQVSDRSINQGTQNPRQPRFVDLSDLCKETLQSGFIPAIHYYAADSNNILRDITKIAESGIDPRTSLIQFNTLPQSVKMLKDVKKIGFGIIFKVAVSNKQSSEGGYKVWKGESVQDVRTGDVLPLLNQVTDRLEVIDYAMFDPSHGTNLELDLNEHSLAVRFGKSIVKKPELSNIGLVYAGGIGPKNVESVAKSLNSFFPNRCGIDTESGVRDKNKLDLDQVRQYLIGYSSSI